MSDGNRGERFAFGVIVACAWTFLLTYSTLNQREWVAGASPRIEQRTDKNSAHKTKRSDNIELLSGVRAPGAHICEEGVDCTQKDLYQQWRSAEAMERSNGIANAQFWLATAGTALLFYGLLLNKSATDAATDAAKAAREANRQARDHFTSERRPWIKLTGKLERAESLFHGPKMSGSATFNLMLKNVGLSPAFDVHIHLLPPRLSYYISDMASTKAEMERLRKTKVGGGRVMFPEDEYPDPRHWTYELENRPGDAHFVYFVGFVSYRFGAGEELHFTPFVYEIKWRTANTEAREPRSETAMREMLAMTEPPD